MQERWQDGATTKHKENCRAEVLFNGVLQKDLSRKMTLLHRSLKSRTAQGSYSRTIRGPCCSQGGYSPGRVLQPKVTTNLKTHEYFIRCICVSVRDADDCETSKPISALR